MSVACSRQGSCNQDPTLHTMQLDNGPKMNGSLSVSLKTGAYLDELDSGMSVFDFSIFRPQCAFRPLGAIAFDRRPFATKE